MYAKMIKLLKGKRKGQDHRKNKVAKFEKLIREEKWSELFAKLKRNSKKNSFFKEQKKLKTIDTSMENANPKDVSSGSSSSISDYDDGSITPLLNLAILYKAPIEIIQLFLDIQPDLCLRVDKRGMAPIHVACAISGCECDLIELLTNHPEGIHATSIQDKDGRTPMHHLMFHVCYKIPHDLDTWKEEGCRSDSVAENEMSVYSNTSMEIKHYLPGGKMKELPMSYTQQELQDVSNSVLIIMQASFSSFFMEDNLGFLPVDILHECKARCNPEELGRPPPKWERTNIVNRLVRKIMVDYYKQQKAIAENRPYYIGRKKDSNTLPTEQSNVTNSSSAANSGKAEFEEMAMNSVGDLEGFDNISLSDNMDISGHNSS